MAECGRVSKTHRGFTHHWQPSGTDRRSLFWESAATVTGRPCYTLCRRTLLICLRECLSYSLYTFFIFISFLKNTSHYNRQYGNGELQFVIRSLHIMVAFKSIAFNLPRFLFVPNYPTLANCQPIMGPNCLPLTRLYYKNISEINAVLRRI